MPLYYGLPNIDAPRPEQHTLDAWSSPLWAVGGAALTPSAGVGYYRRVFVPTSFTIGSVWVRITTAGTGATALANCYVGVFNSAGTRLGVSTSQHTAWATTGHKIIAVSADGGQSLTVGGSHDEYVWVGLLVGTQSTVNVAVRTDYGGDRTMANAGLVASDPFNMGSLGSGLSALPTTITVSSMATFEAPWCALE